MKLISLVERHIIKQNHHNYKELDHLCFLSKNLYNATLYEVRQHYFKHNEYLNYYNVNKKFVLDDQVDYRALPAKVSKHSQMLVDRNFKSFFSLLKKKRLDKYDKKIKIPRYLDSEKGRQILHYEKGALSLKNDGWIKLSKTNVLIKTRQPKDNIKFVRVVPKNQYIVIEVGYEQKILEIKDNSNIAAIDLGLNNLMTVCSNSFEPIIIKGTPLKSINQYFNKKLAMLQNILMINNNRYSSKAINKLYLKRENLINNYLHKASAHLMNHLVCHNISTLVVGYNKEWKQDINIGSINNQKFVQIPFYKLIQILEYKCQLKGINFVLQEESYTSKCSFLDNEDIKKHVIYKGKRVKRGLFKSSNGILINADLNGSLNIVKKYYIKQETWNVQKWTDLVEVCSMPKVVSFIK